MNDLTFRPATHNDLARVIELLADDALGTSREDLSDPPAPAYQKAFAEITDDPRNELIVATLNEDVVGCLQLTYIPGLSRRGAERAQIESVRVASTLRGQGYGQKLFEWAIERARDKNCALVQLTTDTSRAGAQEFYQRLGFTPSHVGMKLSL